MFLCVLGCDNAKIYIWNLPKEGLTETLDDYDSYLMSKTFSKKKLQH